MKRFVTPQISPVCGLALRHAGILTDLVARE
jgi:hypothetical protein